MGKLIVWHDETPESKVATDLLPFFEAVIKEVARHVPEKGYDYKNDGWLNYFKDEAHKLSGKYADVRNENVGEALDATAMLAFAWLHETGNMERDEI